jgi:hypothetical protein
MKPLGLNHYTHYHPVCAALMSPWLGWRIFPLASLMHAGDGAEAPTLRYLPYACSR